MLLVVNQFQLSLCIVLIRNGEHPVKELMSEMVHLYDVVQEQSSESGCQDGDMPAPVQ